MVGWTLARAAQILAPQGKRERTARPAAPSTREFSRCIAADLMLGEEIFKLWREPRRLEIGCGEGERNFGVTGVPRSERSRALGVPCDGPFPFPETDSRGRLSLHARRVPLLGRGFSRNLAAPRLRVSVEDCLWQPREQAVSLFALHIGSDTPQEFAALSRIA